MKQNQEEQQDKKKTNSLPIITAKQNATDLKSLLDYLELHQQELKETLTNHGAIAIRGYEVKNPDQFQQVGLSIFPNLQKKYQSGAPRQKAAEYVWTASSLPSYMPLPGHTELAYSPLEKPAYILFFCSHVAASGGETPVIDMKSVLSDLPEQLRQKCSHTRLAIKNIWGRTEKKIFDVRLWKWPWFRSPKTWPVVFSTENRGLVDAKCREVGREIEWLTNGDIIVTGRMPIISAHPTTKEIVWTGWLPMCHLWGMCIEAWFVAKHQRKIRSWLVFLILLLITLVQSGLGKLSSGDRQCRFMDVEFEDGTNFSLEDVYQIVKSYWYNAEMFDWQEGDILIFDNHRMGHGRLPFTGERRVYTAFA